VLTRARRDLPPDRQEAFTGEVQRLVGWAASSTTTVFAERVRALVRRLQDDGGEAVLARQQRAVRLNMWVDPLSGMGCVRGEFDPVTYATLHRRIVSTVNRLFTETTPPEAPSDPLARQAFLRGHALATLIAGGAGGVGRPEVIVVVDATEPGPPVLDWGLPVQIPDRVLFELAARAEVMPVIVRNGIVLHAEGVLDLGRTTRHPNRAQRRVLRALYPTCGVPGCAVLFDACHLHHVIWWRHQGLTDLANVVPLCNRHHHAVHDQHWQLVLHADRTLIITYHNGQQQTTGPPKRKPKAA
jgi:hypothetical protein